MKFIVTSGDLKNAVVECESINDAAITAINKYNPKNLAELIEMREFGLPDFHPKTRYALTKTVLKKSDQWQETREDWWNE